LFFLLSLELYPIPHIVLLLGMATSYEVLFVFNWSREALISFFFFCEACFVSTVSDQDPSADFLYSFFTPHHAQDAFFSPAPV